MPDRAPAYVSARSADEILSTIRPTKIKSESLRSLNIFLDELLWLVLHSARSLATNRLKAGLLQVMPGTVGKDAVLEAEVELRAYKQRTQAAVDEHGVKQTDFPLQPTFELLRQKCEAYCTLGDLEENAAAEAALQEKMMSAGSSAPKPEQITPASLYLTAIIEHICEHVLNNVGQVVARDSSRGTAYSLDVYTALCEDTAIYPLFKTMKVHEQIEAQSRAFRPSHGGSSSISGGSRTRSISRVRSDEIGPARKMSMPSPSAMMPSNPSPTNPPSSFARRPSADAVLATSQQTVTRSATTLSGSSKSSLERTRSSLERLTGKKSMDGGRTGEKSSRGMKLFGKGSARTSSEEASHMAAFPTVATKEAPSGPDERSGSSLSDGTRRPMVAFQQGPGGGSDAGDDSDDAFTQDFDELMRSGATMKVSLTPDRLKTFELINRFEQVFAKQKNQRSRGQPDGSSSAPPPLPTSYSDPTTMTPAARASTGRREVDAILEADESQSRSRTHSTAKFLSEEPPVPAAPVPAAPSSVGRSRSHTESSTSRPSISGKASTGPALLRKASFNGASRSSPDTTPPNEPSRSRKVSEAPKLAAMPDMPVRKRGVARRRESMDLDEILDEPVAPRRGGVGLTAKPAHQTANTRDLIDFLSEGPPEPSPHVARSVSSGAIDPGPTIKPKQSGRWFRRLVGGSTSERAAIPVPDVPEPAPARVIGKQKSATNIRGNSASGFAFTGKIPPSPALSLDTSLQPQASLSLSRKVSPNRKAVPSWDVDARSPDAGSAPSTGLLSPQRDVFTSAPRPPAARQSQDPLPTLSPASSKPSSLKRVPVPKLDDDMPSHTEVSEHGLQLVPEPKTPKTERRRPEKIQEPHIPEVKSIQPTRPASPRSLISPAQAAELRSAIAHATSADECRMLLDMVLGQWGVGRHDPEPSAVPPLSAGCSDFDDSDEAMAVDMLLGEGSMRTERQWPLTPKDSHPRLHEARVASSLRSSE